MTNSRFYSSTASVTSLQVTVNPSDASIQVASSAGWPSSFPFTVSLDYGSANEELVDVTGGGPNIFTVTRAVDGTSATTHNAGAVVRHVSSARDFTDSRTHESSTSGVHGITGSFVDTLSVQTLSNKTLNNPTINNATLAGTIASAGSTHTGGTFSGSTLSGGTLAGTTTVTGGTFAGAWTNAGDLTNTGQLLQQNLLRGQRANAGDSIYESRKAGDAKARWFMTADGGQNWGDGTNNADVGFFRLSAGVQQLTGSLSVTGGVTAATGTFSTLNATTFAGNPNFTGTPTFVPATISGSSLVPDTVTNGWSLDSATGRKAGGVTTIKVNVERVGSNIVASASGNITDTKLGTLAAGWRPVDGTMVTNYDMSGIATGSVSIGTDGIMTIKSLSAGNTIGLADTVNLSLTFVSST